MYLFIIKIYILKIKFSAAIRYHIVNDYLSINKMNKYIVNSSYRLIDDLQAVIGKMCVR